MKTETKTKTKNSELETAMEAVPRIHAAIRRPGTEYVGPAIVQSPGGWARIGPTWIVAGIGWVTFGPGLRRWGTTQGLAELASGTAPVPEYHAEGWSVSPAPNIVYAVSEMALQGNPQISRVRDLAAQAAHL